MPTQSNVPDPRDVYRLPPLVVTYPVHGDNPWVTSGQCDACGGEFRGETYFDISFSARHRAGPPYYSGIGMLACSRKCAARLTQELPLAGRPLPIGGNPTDPALQHHGWIFAFRGVGEYPDDTERSGKWMVYWKPEEVDDGWNQIRDALREGKLGYEAKAATRPKQWSKGLFYVTLVYTYDSDDLDDVRRVREELRLMGVTWKIGYKEDRETVQGHYSSSGKPVSKYWE